jgi:excisionase family DNA binding protein
VSWRVDGPIRDEDDLPAVVLTARQAASLWREFARMVDAHDRRDGGVSPGMQSLRAQMAASAAAFRAREAEPRAEPRAEPLEQARSSSGTLDLVDLGKLVDVNEAADIVGCSPERIRRLVAEEVLPSFPNQRGHHRIPLDDVEAYRDERSRHKRSEITS